MSIADKLTQVAENVPKVYEAGKINFGRKKSVSGEALYLDDINPNKHKMDVKVRSKNMFNINGSLGDAVITNGLHKLPLLLDDGKLKSTADFGKYRGAGQFISVAPNTTYTLSYTVDTINATKSILQVLTVDANNHETILYNASPTILTPGEYTTTFTTPEDAVYIWLSFNGCWSGNDGDYTIYDKVQLELGSVATEYSPYVDTSTVNVTACEKNLIKLDRPRKTEAGVTYSPSNDGTIIANGVSTGSYYGVTKVKVYKGLTYSMSKGLTEENSKVYMYAKVNGNYVYAYNSGISFTPLYDQYFEPTVVVQAGIEADNIIFKPQIEISDTPTDFEPFNGTTYTPNADGTVDGVTSLSPVMNIFTDTAGVIINAEYYQDVANFNIDTENDKFWEEYQEGGKRKVYNYRFSGYYWNDKTFKPKYDIKTSYGVVAMFQRCLISDLAGILDTCGVKLDIYDNVNFSYICSNCEELTTMPKIDLSKPNISSLYEAFSGDRKLHTIRKIKVCETTPFDSTTFRYCSSLENISFEGLIGSNIYFSDSPLLSKDSTTNIFEHLSPNVTGKKVVINANAVTNAFGSTTADEWLELVATKPNWTVELV